MVPLPIHYLEGELRQGLVTASITMKRMNFNSKPGKYSTTSLINTQKRLKTKEIKNKMLALKPANF